MNTTKKLICILTASVALGSAAPAFADSFRDRGYDNYRHSNHYREFDRRDFGRHGYREFDRRHVVVVERPVIVQRPYYVEPPVYYSQPAPVANVGLGAVIGATIGTIIDNRY